MKKILITLLLYCCTTHFVCAVNKIPEKLIYQDSVLLFCVHNNQIITIARDKEQNYLLSVGGKIDTLREQINVPPQTRWRNVEAYYSEKNSIYFTFNSIYGGGQYNLYRLNLDNKKIETVSTLGGYYYLLENTLVREYRDYEDCMTICLSLVFDDLQTKRADTLAWGNFISSDLLPGNKILISNYDEEIVYSFSYYDWNNRKFIEHIPVLDTMRFERFLGEDGVTYYRHHISQLRYSYKDISDKYSNLGLFWVDQNFNPIQPTVEPNHRSRSSFNINADNNIYYYRSSFIEGRKTNKSVWIACKFTLAFDKALYDIYNDTELAKSDVEKFDEWELHKLKNMIFAKHGYQFQSEYLQAFFNLFSFYNHINKKSDVNHLLMPVDKKNLLLIQQIM